MDYIPCDYVRHGPKVRYECRRVHDSGSETHRIAWLSALSQTRPRDPVIQWTIARVGSLCYLLLSVRHVPWTRPSTVAQPQILLLRTVEIDAPKLCSIGN